MFTGIIQCVGKVAELKKRGAGARLTVGGAAGALRRLKLGSSIAVNGCCLTIVAKRGGTFSADLTAETLRCTALGGYRAGDRVNLEPPLRVGDDLSGHMLQGHIDGTARVLELVPDGRDGGWRLRVAVPAELRKYLAFKGSLGVDGISLTIAALDQTSATFAIIPHTYSHTHLAQLRPGGMVNLETDPLARHLERLLEARTPAKPAPLSRRELARQGF